VITGHDRTEVGALVFLNAAAVKAKALDEAAVRAHLRAALAKVATESARGARPTRRARS